MAHVYHAGMDPRGCIAGVGSSEALTRSMDRVVDASMVAFAAWTVAYHVCLVLRLGVPWAWSITGVCLVGWWWVWRRLSGRRAHAGSMPGQVLALTVDWSLVGREWTAVLAVLAAVVTALGMALSAPWTMVWIGWLVAGVAGTSTAWRWLRCPGESPGTAASALERWSPVIVLGWAVVFAVLSLWTLYPSGDDLYYVNLSQWVATHGQFPVRDTLFAELRYPMSNWPPAASYDPLVGAVAALAGVKAATIAYIVVPPVASFMAVLGLWRLLRTWELRPAVVGVSVALLALLVGAHAGSTPGAALVVRIWQGKFIFAWVMVPWLLVHMVRYFEHRSRRRLWWLFTGGVAAVGLTTTAIFVVPVMAVAGAVPLIRSSWRQAVACFAVTAAYPLGAGVVTKAIGGRSADLFDTRKLYRFDADYIGHLLFDTGPMAVVLVLCVLLGAMLVPHRASRVTTGVLVVALGIVFIPGATHLSYNLIGLGPTIRRVKHGLDFVALVAVAVVRLGSIVRRRRGLGLAAAATAATVFFAFVGTPMISQASTWERPFHWQLRDSDRAVPVRIARAGPLDGLLLAPKNVSIATAVTTTAIQTVTPKEYYMDYLRADPSFHFRARELLYSFVNNRPWNKHHERALTHALETVHVAVACVDAVALGRARGQMRAGMRPYFRTRSYRCFD
jgi:hypothetical protein